MLDLKQIESFYPEPIRKYKKNILREYLQYKILEILYDSPHANKLAFMGGTAIRIVHGHNRFSEDLDFDNLSLGKPEFEELVESVKNKLELTGYSIEQRIAFKQAYHSYINIVEILYDNQLSGHREEKLTIRLDVEPQELAYTPDKIIINKFDVFTRIFVVPVDILLAQKLLAILYRKRTMGRDFLDTIYLLGKSKINFDYLKQKSNITNMVELKSMLLSKITSIDSKLLLKDVEAFLIDPDDSKKILLFGNYIATLS